MATGAELNRIALSLGMLQQQIKRESLRLIAEGSRPAIDDPGYQGFFNKLNQWSSQLDLITKRLRSIERDLAFKREQAKGVPRQHRFRAQQSISDHERHLREIARHASRAAAYLTRIYQMALTPTGIDINKGVFQLAEHTLDEFKAFAELERLSAQQTSATATAAVSKARHELHAPRANTPDALMGLVLVVQLLRIWWLERLRQGGRT